jgi:hypothetical protein
MNCVIQIQGIVGGDDEDADGGVIAQILFKNYDPL